MRTDTLFISDLHLDAAKPHLTALFKHFCEHIAPKARAVYILGDFFDVWYSDKQSTPWIESIQDQLKRLTQQGIPVYLMVGNRDFMLGKRFAKACGCELLPDPSVITLAGRHITLCHGDQLCLADTRYQRYRYWIRHPITQTIAKCLPESLLAKLAKNIRQTSQQKTTTPHDSDMVDEKAVTALCEQHDSHTMIHGHTHVQGEWSHPGKLTRLVLPMWDDQGGGLAWSSDGHPRFFAFDAGHAHLARNNP